MNIDRQDASIELSAKEVEYLRGKAETPATLLEVQVTDRRRSFVHQYPSFQDRVEHAAEELYAQTDRTVLIMDSECEIIARYNERGFVFD